MKTGLLGGTFDPVHNAHLAMARAALEQLRLDRILFLPTGATHYREPARAPAADRVAMLKLALAGEPRYAIDERELAAGHSGYTVDTLLALRLERPVLLLGADQFSKIDSWHRADEVKRLAEIAVFPRPGFAIPPKVTIIEFAPMNLSSTDIRRRAARGEDLAALVPPAVARYIAQHGLYR